MTTTDPLPRPRRLPRTVTAALLAAPLAIAALVATTTSVSASPSPTADAPMAEAPSVDATTAVGPVCANCHQTLNHQAPL